MDIREIINTLVANTEEIKKAYPTVENVRHCIYDIPYADLKAFAGHIHARLNTDTTQRRAYIIHSPMVDGKMDSDIWIYSKPVTIKPAEIIEE
jgi:hypothetical protein